MKPNKLHCNYDEMKEEQLRHELTSRDNEIWLLRRLCGIHGIDWENNLKVSDPIPTAQHKWKPMEATEQAL